LEYHPAAIEFLYSLAGCYFAQNKLDQARREVEKVMLLSPGHEKAMELARLVDERRAVRA
jgi:hypothetical protein